MSVTHQSAQVTSVETCLAYDYANQLRADGALMPETRGHFIVELKKALDCTLLEARR